MKIQEIAFYVNQQLKNMLITECDVTPYIEEAIDKTLYCFSFNKNKYFQGLSEISVFHSGQYSIFLYYLSNIIYKKDNKSSIPSKLYYLNKILHSVDWYYEIELPSYWGVEHPVGSVLGRAKYNDGFFIYQGCTVGGNNSKYPSLGKNVILFSNSSVLGESVIGENVIISTGTVIKDYNIPSNSIIFGHSPNLIIKQKNEEEIHSYIDQIWIRDRRAF